jgi:formylglycine-generating enzyme required for sulfatase activity
MTETDAAAAQPERGQHWTEPLLNMEFIWIEDTACWVAKHMITNGEFRQFRPDHDSGSFEGHSLNEERQPVVEVSYVNAMEFCEWLTGRLANEAGFDKNTLCIRLPSHDEWTAFATCGDGREYPWGNDWPPTCGNYGDEAAKRAFPEWEHIDGVDNGFAVSCPVEDSGENDWGLFGVGGNAYEWTFEAHGMGLELRGASWSTSNPMWIRVMNRYQREPGSTLLNFGFRLILA